MKAIASDAAVYRALGTTFTMMSDQLPLLQLLDALWIHCETNLVAEHLIEVVSTPDGFVVGIDGVETVRHLEPSVVVSRVVWEVNQLARNSLPDQALLHAALVQIGDRGVVVCGASGSGKSTLTAKLVERGAVYLGDEIVPIDDGTPACDAYLKPLTLRSGSWEFVESLIPDCGPDQAEYLRDTWFVTPHVVAPTTNVALVVHTLYSPGAPTRGIAIEASENAVALFEQTHHLASSGERAFRAVCQFARSVAAMRLVVNDLDVASFLIASAANWTPS